MKIEGIWEVAHKPHCFGLCTLSIDYVNVRFVGEFGLWRRSKLRFSNLAHSRLLINFTC
jgi:hypothetical protein